MTDTESVRGGVLDWPLWLAGQGFTVFKADHPTLPQCAGVGQFHDPATCTDRGKHPAVAFTYRNTKDQDEVRRQFGGGTFNVAIFVGGCEGPGGKQLMVMDSDRPHALEDVANALGYEHTPTMRVYTAKGHHDYYWAPTDARLGNSLGALKGKFDGDVRAGNAYVIGPGSMHATGVVYTLEDDTQPPVDAPEWLLAALQDRGAAPARPVTGVTISADRYDKYTRKALQAECNAITNAPVGSQNNQINASAFSIGTIVGAGGLSEGEAWDELLSAARAGNHPEGRAISAINSGLGKGMTQPRHPWPPISRRDDEAELRALIAPDDGQGIDWNDIEDTPPAEPEPTAPAEDQNRGLLPPEFYKSRPIFEHIQCAAHSRGCSADVLLFATLARMSGMISHNIKADTGIGSPASLNLFVAVVGGSGSGKSTSSSLNRELMPAGDPEFRDGLPVGTGEGIAEMFMGTVDEETGEIHRGGPNKGDPVTRKVRKQVRHNGYIYVDEGESMATLAMRSGSVLSETLRRAAIGEALGQTNASEERTRFIAAGSYSLGLLVGFQPSTALPLLADASTGTPQRFVWGLSNDPSIPDQPAVWPGLLVDHPGLLRPTALSLIAFPDRIRKMLWAERVGRARGEIEVAELDGHAGLIKVKLAALFALLDGNRFAVNEDDWTLAETVWATSCAVRDGLVARARREAEAERKAQSDARVLEELRSHEAKADADRTLERIARLVLKHASCVGGITWGELNRRLANRDRPRLNKAMDLAESRDWVFVEGDRICVRTA